VVGKSDSAWTGHLSRPRDKSQWQHYKILCDADMHTQLGHFPLAMGCKVFFWGKENVDCGDNGRALTIQKAIEFYLLNRQIVWYVDCATIRLFGGGHQRSSGYKSSLCCCQAIRT
jgi:hypothetical protein